tara:strand:- start:107 stop:586 length:480 start_codon:yes stop_codon:yes gene_type:complete
MSKIEVNEIARRSGSSPIPIPGHVIQVVEAVSSGDLSLSSGSDQTVLSASITPTSTSSKILIQCLGLAHHQEGNSATNTIYAKIFRGTSSGTAIKVTKAFAYGTVNTKEVPVNFAISKLDSPSTTSSQTYTWTVSCTQHSIHFKTETAAQTITLMEIAQ